MKTQYLIQRCKQEDRSDYKKGIDSILKFDYMGSSEFEWGALPNSLKSIRENIADYTYMDIPLKDKVVTVFCHNSHKESMEQYLKDLAEKKHHLKEWAGFAEVLKDEEFYVERVDCWWDIVNNLIFWFKDNEFEKQFKEKVEPK